MNKKSNFISMLKREGYDYAPVEFFLCPSLEASFKVNFNTELSYQVYFDMPWRSVDDGKVTYIDESIYRSYYPFELKEGTKIDSWGVAHEPGSEAAMHMTYMRHPLKELTTLEELEAYPYPDFKVADYTHQKAQCDAIHAQGLAALGDMQMTIWEASWYLRSMEQLMMDMIVDKEKATFIIDRVLELSIHRAKQYALAGCDILFFGDDIGMQSSIMMSTDMYVEWFKPRLTKLIKEVKAINPDILVFYHSCGFVEPFIPHLIESGVDVLNPVQPECMDFEELHTLYGNQISFHGTIGTQTSMPFGTPEEIKKLVTRNLTLAGKKGGLFCAPTHLLEPEVPWENIMAYIEACREFDPSLL
jgi:uroporphyrinogen decarboxylase